MSRVIGVPGMIWYSGSRAVRSGLIVLHVRPSSVERCSTWLAW
jgi:hypothetical protein